MREDSTKAFVLGDCGVGYTLLMRIEDGAGQDETFGSYLDSHGRFVSANATMSGSGRDTDWLLADEMHKIGVDDRQYEIPNDMIFGSR